MSVNNFVSEFANAVEIEAARINAQSVYKSLENWDSLCALSVIAMVDDAYQVTLGGEDLEAADTIGDLWNLITTKQ